MKKNENEVVRAKIKLKEKSMWLTRTRQKKLKDNQLQQTKKTENKK